MMVLDGDVCFVSVPFRLFYGALDALFCQPYLRCIKQTRPCWRRYNTYCTVLDQYWCVVLVEEGSFVLVE